MENEVKRVNFTSFLEKSRTDLGESFSAFFFLLHTLNRGYHSKMMKIAQELDLSVGQPNVLVYLNRKGTATQRDICNFMQVRPATMTDVLQRMEKAGLVLRKRSEEDQRKIYVSLTAKGEKKSVEFLKKEMLLEKEVFHGFTNQEKLDFLQYFVKITKNMNGGNTF